MKIRKPSLHVTILTLFLSFILITAGSLTWYNYNENSQAAQDIATQLLCEVSDEVTARIEYLFESTTRMSNEVAELPYLSDKPDFMRHPAQWLIAERLLARPHLYSAYIGYADGDFYQVISLSNASLRKHLLAPEETRLGIRKVFDRPGDGKRVELWQFFDQERRLVGSRGLRFSSYDPRERPWFRQAIGKEGIVHTPFYIFKSTGSMGITFAHRFDGDVPGVFGVDVTLAGLSRYFGDLKIGKSGYAFMFNEALQITAHPDQDKILTMTETLRGHQVVRLSLKDMADPMMAELTREIKNWDHRENMMLLETGESRHLVCMAHLNNTHLPGEILAVTAPLSDFTGHMDQTRKRSLLGAAVIILLAIPIAAYNARQMSVALNRLAREADKIRHFKLDSTVNVRSHISEIAELSKAVKTMQMSLRSFGRYVPKTLVKQLLLAKKIPELGGERREATLLFSDIADFTTISESMEAEKLMLKVSEYLQAVSSVILRHEGTIDKYIGDAVMAFWNSPSPQENHAELACDAALGAREASEALNRKWTAEGLPAMHTRFGLHTGDPIIGNVGSDDRMNYTAMGAPVNLASRLEGLNKYCGTQILASESVVKQAGDGFLFRPVGKVMPKGTTIPVSVYELLGRRGGPMDFHVSPEELPHFIETWETAYTAYLDRRFEEAAILFDKCFRINPGDDLAAIMRERAEKLAQTPPDNDWNGVEVFHSK
ncbi:adenylate/guanylate cyclase domain-containing protein [uncultured Pseudodesulfovibrio sp.]|uniref:adenylate/guanylate cyclase domain-containing protein n=1 Tax=uncultured Pseudodesulfovibrio sp. TaxID=2035858 RepID=UPI0029C5FF71|nr:adenylate/guanylate cyclase domain-containing protein [uncultured Pseudodesulfovibrio sp.]